MREPRSLLVLLLAACVTPWVLAQSEDAAQRTRIAQQRRDAEAEFVRREFDCSKRFAVTSCMDKAKSERRAQVDTLRRQEEVLDGNERRHRAAERLEAIRIKTEAQAKLKPVRLEPAASTSAQAVSAADAASAALLPVPVPIPLPGSAEASGAAPERAKTVPKHSPIKGASPGKGAVAADHAADRAAAAQRRQNGVVKQSEARDAHPPSTKPPAAPLPPRPPIPPASSPGS